MVKIAICYFGMSRSTKMVYKTHFKFLFDVLKKHDVEYDTFIHTWKTDCNIIWNKVIPVPNNHNECNLLNPTHFQVDDQDNFTKEFGKTFHLYFNEKLFHDKGDVSDGEWIPMLIRNHLCALESQKRVFKMVTDTGNHYDAVIFIRPDVSLKNEFDVASILNLDEKDIVLVNYEHGEGLNDRFCVGHPKTIGKYANRIDEIEEFRKTNGRIVSEKYVKFIVEKYNYNLKFINFRFMIIRPNGEKIFYPSEWNDFLDS